MSRVIVITGAGAGLGRALARRFLADGEDVVLLGRTRSKIEAVADQAGGRALPIECDISDPNGVRGAFRQIAAQHGHVDVLVNNAVFYQPFVVAEASDEQVERTLGSNLYGAIWCTRSALPLMSSGSHIINVSSESVDMSFPHLVLYQTSKAGLERFSHGLGHELAPAGIRVTLIRAGAMYEEGKTWDVDPDARQRFVEAAQAAGIQLGGRPLSQYASVTDVFRAVIDLPQDVQATTVCLQARAQDGTAH